MHNVLTYFALPYYRLYLPWWNIELIIPGGSQIDDVVNYWFYPDMQCIQMQPLWWQADSGHDAARNTVAFMMFRCFLLWSSSDLIQGIWEFAEFLEIHFFWYRMSRNSTYCRFFCHERLISLFNVASYTWNTCMKSLCLYRCRNQICMSSFLGKYFGKGVFTKLLDQLCQAQFFPFYSLDYNGELLPWIICSMLLKIWFFKKLCTAYIRPLVLSYLIYLFL